MKRNGLIAVVIVLLFSGCHLNTLRGSGNVITESRNVSGISGVSVSGFGHLVIRQDGTEALTITTDDNLMPLITSEVRGGVLELGSTEFENLKPSKEILYRLSVNNLNEIAVSGAAMVEAADVSTDELRIRISGAARISVEGGASTQDIDISGIGEFRGTNFRGNDVRVNISGAGRAVVAASDSLDAQVSGAGKIEYVGDPKLTSNISGAGSIHKQ